MHHILWLAALIVAAMASLAVGDGHGYKAGQLSACLAFADREYALQSTEWYDLRYNCYVEAREN